MSGGSFINDQCKQRETQILTFKSFSIKILMGKIETGLQTAEFENGALILN